MFAKPTMPTGTIDASEPPATITSASPRRMISAASPIACAPVVQAETTEWFGPFAFKSHRDQAARHVDNQHRNQERADAARAARHQCLDCGRQAADAADATADEYADTLSLILTHRARIELGVLDRVERRRDGELAETVGAARFLPTQSAFGVEFLHLAGDLHVIARSIEERDRPDAALPRSHRVPRFLGRLSDGTNHTHARHDDAPPPTVIFQSHRVCSSRTSHSVGHFAVDVP